MLNFRCQKCGSKQRIMFQLVIAGPAEMYAHTRKADFRKKEVEIWGANWETCDFICTNPKCGHVVFNTGNFVTRLKKENELLKKEIERLNAGELTRR
jgi:hypothetical protein